MNDSQAQTALVPETSEAKGEKVVEIKNLQKSFDGQPVLSDVSLDLFKKENLVVLGKSGSGKSVLIKCIVGLLIPDGGEITVFGKSVNALKHNELN
ncbi:MAG TPA: ATP-binding cassette domain-containing protein, partial [Bacteroidia bacterium]|nr:ATP-binding cassette domain-containing protein [Bacteroidia bacterium]